MGTRLSKDMRNLVSKIEDLGFTVRVLHGRHFKLKLEKDGKPVTTLVCAKTPSCRYARANAFAFARRLASK